MDMQDLAVRVFGDMCTPLGLETRIPENIFSDYGENWQYSIQRYTMMDAYELVMRAQEAVEPDLAALIDKHKDDLADYVYDLAHSIERELIARHTNVHH
jgi:hypothetical protein